jgi:HEAT repeat protein
MKRFFAIIIFLALPLAAHCAEEDQWIGVLQSDHSLQEKDAACAQLKWIGTARCVPALAELLTDPQLSDSARYALESMPGPEAGNALRQALSKTSGSNEVGIINSLGARGETNAGPDVARLLSCPDPGVAMAAAEALGHMGGPKALQALQSAWSGSGAGALHDAESDGLLACASRFLTSGDMMRALPIFQSLYDHETKDDVRLEAYRGIILASEKHGLALMVKAIAGSDRSRQAAALQLASKLGGSTTTKALANLLPKLPAPVQMALLQCLGLRGDRAAGLSIAEMLDNADPDVRLAAIAALGDVGDGKVALRLARAAAAATGAEKAAARRALTDLRRGPVTESLLKPLANVAPEVQAELIRALGNRGDASAAPQLLALAGGGNDSTRSAALQALTVLAGPAQVPGLVQLVINATNNDARSEAADALGSTCQHIESQGLRVDAAALILAVQTAPIEARVALLGVCSGVSDPQIREALRAAASDADARVREAAIRALCSSQDEQFLPDILKVACGAKEENFRMLGIRACVRLVTQDQPAPLPVAQKIDALKAILNSNPNAEGKRLILSGLSSIADSQALALAAAMLDDPAVKVEAAQSIIQIAGSPASIRPEEAGEALKKVLTLVTDPATQASAQEAQKKAWKMSGYVTLWQVAGPYQQPGKNFSELFDIPFAPETGDSTSVHWQNLSASANPAEWWKMDLLQALGGEQRVAYARTWINSPHKQNVRLKLGSDDGVKVWLDGRVVYANNVSRGLVPDSDEVDVTLKPGWSCLMLKVTQNNAGWEFCVRFAEPSGEPVAGLQASLSPVIP